jgi:tRNA(Ile)-lysidine synthase
MNSSASTEAHVRRVLETLLHQVTTDTRAGVLVALSGGADSTALLHILTRWRTDTGRPVEAAHLNHGLRGLEADEDTVFCRNLCRRLDVPLHERLVDTAAEARWRGRGLEEAGRALRHNFFIDILDENPHLGACATAHHRDDQLETLLIRLFRGTGPDGLAGIRPVTGRLIRPLLDLERIDLAQLLTEWDEGHCIDPTNADGSNLRGRVRHELLPLIRNVFGDGAPAAPQRLAELLADDAAELDRQADTLLNGVEAAASLPIPLIADRPRAIASRLVRRWIRLNGGPERGVTRTDLERLFDWLPASRSGSYIDLGEGWQVLREFDALVLAPPEQPDTIETPVRLLSRTATPEELASPAPEIGLDPGPGGWSLTLPRDAVRGWPHLRLRRDGDRITPFGMKGRKTVADVLQEAQVPERLRSSVHVVEDDNGPFWVVGVARDERTRLLPSTEDAVTLVVQYRT